MDPNEHFGSWTCEIGVFSGATVSAPIIVGKVEDARIEFDTYYGQVTLDIGKQPQLPLQCNAFPKNDDAQPFSSQPGKMTFDLKGFPLTDVTDWQQVHLYKIKFFK